MIEKKVETKRSSKVAHVTTASVAWWQWIVPPSVLAILVTLFYYPSVKYDFQFDDVANIRKYFEIRHHTFSSLFFTGPRWISYWLNTINYSVARFDPWIYRSLNIAIHACTGIMVFFLIMLALSRLKKESFFTQHATILAYLTAGLFLLHPVQTQTVSYVIQGQLEGLATLFTVAISLCFLLFADARSSVQKYFFGSFLFVLGIFACGTKEICVVAPFLLMLIDWFFVAQGEWPSFKKRLIFHGIFFAVIWGTYMYFLKPSFFAKIFGLQIQARNNIGNVLTENPKAPITPMHFFISQFKVMVHYMWMFVWPFNISVEYDWKLVKGFFSLDCFLPFVAIASLLSYTAQLFRKDSTNLFCFAIAWFFIAIAPRTSVIPSSELLADYKTYLASIGILFLLAAVIIYVVKAIFNYAEGITKSFNNVFVRYAVFTLILIPLGFTTYTRNFVWRSAAEFWANIIKNAPQKARAYNNYGVALSEQGKFEESIPFYRKAISMDRNYPDPCNNLAVAYSMAGKNDLAIETLKESIKIQPYYPEAYNNLASFLINKKDYDNAEKMLNVAIQLRPYYGKAYFNLGKLAMLRENKEQAFSYFKKACFEGDFDNEVGFQVFANVAMALEKFDDAILGFTKALEFNPNNTNNVLNLGSLYLVKKEFAKAIPLLQHVTKINPKEPRAWYNLGESFYLTRQFNAAIEAYMQAKQLNYPLPQMYIRLADCLHEIGKDNEAKMLLVSVLSMPGLPEEIKKTINLALNEINRIQNTAQTKKTT